MNENLNLVEILKDCPTGTRFYTPVWGEISFRKVLGNKIYGISIDTCSGNIYLTKEGCYLPINDAECIIFPSKDQRDWSKFTAPWYNKLVEPNFKVGDKIVNLQMKYMGCSGAKGAISEITDDKYIFTDGSCMFISNQDNWKLDKDRFDPKTLKPFDKVLVRDSDKDKWDCELFSLMDENLIHKFKCCGLFSYIYCIPYNDETKHLVGTNQEAPEYYRYWED